MRNFVPIIFYGNIFYGLCAIALCLETNLQHHLRPNGVHFYFLVFAVTVLYYTRIYYQSSGYLSTNQRTAWYTRHRQKVAVAMMILIGLIVVDAIIVFFKYLPVIPYLNLLQWSLILVFPAIAFLYTFKTFPFLKSRQLRGIGWLKPFFIGFAWSGLVTVYPVIFRQVQSGLPARQFIFPSGLFWLQNFLFISALAVMFDIKDYMSDVRYKLKTYPAILGNAKTITVVVLPTVAISFAVLLVYLLQQHASAIQITVQSLPYLLLLPICTMLNQRGILFYLVVIDGLMLLKGLCGIISIILF